MESRRRRSSRIDRWLREITDSDRKASPLDFAEVAALSKHTCDNNGGGSPDGKPKSGCTLRPTTSAGVAASIGDMVQHHQPHNQPHPSSSMSKVSQPHQQFSAPGAKHQHQHQHQHQNLHQQQHQHQHQHQPQPAAVSESPLSTGSSSSSTNFSSTDSNTDLKQSSRSTSLASSLDSNKMKVVKWEHHRAQNQPPQKPQQQLQQQQQQQQRPNTKQNWHGASGDHVYQDKSCEKSGLISSSDIKEAPAGVTYYFHLKQIVPKERGQELLVQMKSMKESDKSLQQISANRGVTITLGRGIEPVPAGHSTASYRRKVIIQGASWRSVMESVNDLSHMYPEFMSQAPPENTKPAEPESQATRRKTETKQPQPQLQPQPQPQPQPQQQQHIMPTPKLQNVSAMPQLQPQHHTSTKQPPQPPPPSASVTGAAAHGPVSGGACANRALSKASGRQAKLAQNVRFQLTTSQRESLFTQDETGKPTHLKLKALLSSLRMDLVFLERSVNQENVPSVKVRFFFESFDQLTAFCKAIDYQIPAQG